jgi:peptide chain release factor 1
MLDQFEGIYAKFKDLEILLSSPEIVQNMDRFTKLNKEYSDLKGLADIYLEYRNVISNISEAKEIQRTEKDADMLQMAKDELDILIPKKEAMEEDIKILLIPKDPEDNKNVVIEIRSGTGGDEASLFAGDLFKMYDRYCTIQGWTVEVLDIMEGTVGGYSKIVFEVSGQEVYGTLKFESGVHRVQRVPDTESQGRVHTSAATVAILPEADEVDVKLDLKDVRRDTYRSSGAGGQHVNKTESAVRLTHIPSGIVVECQEGRSQHKNYDKALSVLRTKLYETELQKKQEEIAKTRKTLVSTGDRSAKIRTYNFPQGRVTDHRINLTLYNLPAVLNGEIQEIIDKLRMEENAEKMKLTQN